MKKLIKELQSVQESSRQIASRQSTTLRQKLVKATNRVIDAMVLLNNAPRFNELNRIQKALDEAEKIMQELQKETK